MINSRPVRGFATLTVTLLVIVFVTGLSLMSGKILVAEQRVAANEMRYREAMAAAQGGLEAALARLKTDRTWRTTVSASGSTLYTASFAADTPITIGSVTQPAVNITSVGSSVDGGASATVRQQVIVVSVVARNPDSPMLVVGGLSVGGNFQLVANPNGGGAGVPLSVWTDKAVDLSKASGETCGLQEWQDGTCSSSPYSSAKTGKGPDILDSDPNFPKDMLNYIFGVPDTAAGMATLEGRAKAILSGCSSLNASSTGFYIVDGECKPSGTVGSAAAPVVVLLRNGDLVLGANIKLHGLLFAYDSDPATLDYDIKMNGTASVNGALISNYPPGKANGTYNAVYDPAALNTIQIGQQFITVSRIPGSWRDW